MGQEDVLVVDLHKTVQKFVLMAVLKQLASLLVCHSQVAVCFRHFLELLQEVLFKAVQARLQMLLLGLVLRDELLEGVLDPDLVIVRHVALLEQVEGVDRLDKVAAELRLFLLGQVYFRPLQVGHIVDQDCTRGIDADEEHFPAHSFDKLGENESGLICVLL